MTVADQYSNVPDLHGLWDYNDPAGAESRFRAGLAKAEASDDRGCHAELLTQIARAQGLQRQFNEAHRSLDEADAMIDGDMHRARVRYLLERGRVYNSSGSADQARPLFVEAWALATREHFDRLAVDAAHMLGIIESGDSALCWSQQALDLANASSDPDAQSWKGSLCNNIGWTYHSEDEFERALEYFEQALEHRVTQGKAGDVRVARWCVAKCLRSLERVEEALAIQRELEQQIAAIENPDGYVYEELAECLYALGRNDEAKPYFRRAYKILSKDAWLTESEPKRIERLAELGGTSR